MSVMAGHMGVTCTIERVTSEYFWPGYTAEIVRYVKSCDICQRALFKSRSGKVPLGDMPITDIPFRCVAVYLNESSLRVLSHFRGGGLRTSVTRIAMLAGVFILLLGPPKPDRLKVRGQTK